MTIRARVERLEQAGAPRAVNIAAAIFEARKLPLPPCDGTRYAARAQLQHPLAKAVAAAHLRVCGACQRAVEAADSKQGP
jgi:hypothetical protein